MYRSARSHPPIFTPRIHDGDNDDADADDDDDDDADDLLFPPFDDVDVDVDDENTILLFFLFF
jgi:hypothetical protein